MKSFILFLGLSVIIISGCCKKNPDKTGTTTVDSMTWSYHGGFTPTPQLGYYKLTGSAVFADTVMTQPKTDVQYQYQYGNDKCESVKDLLGKVPARLLDANNTTFDAEYVDGPDFSITAYKDGHTYQWRIFHEPKEEYVKDFSARLMSATMVLKQ